MSQPTAPNPLLTPLPLPTFSAISPEHVVPAMDVVLGEVEAGLAEVEAVTPPTWDTVMGPLERLVDRLQTTWGVVTHLLGVRNSEALRAAHAEVQPRVVALSIRLAQSPALHGAFVALRAGPDGEDPTRRRILDSNIRDAELSGVALQGEARERFGAIAARLAELSTAFSNHVLDATAAWSLVLTTPDDVVGLPPSYLAMAAQSARGAGEPDASAEAGPWRITLDYPSFGPFLRHAARRDLREQVYRAYVSRASSGERDNGPLIDEILALRREKAALLGFGSYAELSLASKMAASVDQVRSLLGDLLTASQGPARQDLDDLQALAAARGEDAPLAQWDLAYWAERLREERYAIEEEALRPWFPFPRVLSGLLARASSLFDVRFAEATDQVDTWHPSVRYYRVLNGAGDDVAGFFLDPYARPADKRGGAWMDECVGRSARLGDEGAPRLPVAYLVCNGTPPVDGKPSLMTFREVETLFHEFGHGLQHMLTAVDEGLASGIRNVEWDAVELPSQFMENWCYHRPTVALFSGHVDTGEPLPDAIFDRLNAARTFRAGSAMMRQLDFALTDLALHHEYRGERPVLDVRREISAQTSVLPPLPEDRFLCAFSHIFAGGYAAGYYSYKWAEVLSADAFGAFEDAGLDDPEAVAATGRRFRDTVLASGGAAHPMEVFEAFRGRPPTSDALLRHAGLAA